MKVYLTLRQRPAGTLRHRARSALVGLATLAILQASAQELTAPPYFISSANALVIGVTYDEISIKGMIPEDLKIAPGANGQVIMYVASEAYGLPAFSSSYMAVDLAGFDAPGGAKARWMVTGLYSPGGVANSLVTYFNYPVREGSTRLEHEGRKLVAIGSMGGRDMIRAEIILKPEPCQRGSGLIHEVTRKRDTKGTQLIHVPYVADWCAAETAKVEILAPGGDLFDRMRPIKVTWAGLFRGGFGWSLAPGEQ